MEYRGERDRRSVLGEDGACTEDWRRAGVADAAISARGPASLPPGPTAPAYCWH